MFFSIDMQHLAYGNIPGFDCDMSWLVLSVFCHVQEQTSENRRPHRLQLKSPIPRIERSKFPSRMVEAVSFESFSPIKIRLKPVPGCKINKLKHSHPQNVLMHLTICVHFGHVS